MNAPSQRRGPHVVTLLQQWIDRMGIPSARLEATLKMKLKRKAPSRTQFGRWRLGRAEPRRKDIVRIVWAAQQVSGDPTIQAQDLFDFNTTHEDIWR
jgi:hypothetical protein